MNEITVVVDGAAWTFARLDYRLFAEFVAWYAARLPNPIDDLLATAAKLPEAMRERYIADRIDAADAKQRIRGTLSDPDVQAFAANPAALGRLLWLLLRKHHPAVTESQATDVVYRAVEEHGPGVFDPVFRAVSAPQAEEAVEAAYFRGPGAGRAAAGGGR